MKYKHPWQLLLCAVLLQTFTACHYNEGKSTRAANAPAADVALAKLEETPGNAVAADSGTFYNAGAPTPPQDNGQERQQRHQQPQQGAVPQSPAPDIDWDKKIIKNATLSVEVKDYIRFNELMRSAVKQSGGYIAQEEQNESDYKIENTVTIKVPVDQFDNAVAALTPGKEKVLIRKITSLDVTGEVVDAKSRLEAKRQVRLRYLDLLKQAKNMEEILQVQNEINELQEHMEATAGRINYLSHAAAFSTIQLSYFQVLNPQAKDTGTPPGFGKKVLLALEAGLEWVGELIILLLTLWPVWIVLLTGWWLFRRYRPARRITATPPVPPAEQGM